jgi:hypothetical protein
MINDYAVSAWKKGSVTEEHHEEFLKHFAPENSPNISTPPAGHVVVRRTILK